MLVLCKHWLEGFVLYSIMARSLDVNRDRTHFGCYIVHITYTYNGSIDRSTAVTCQT